MLKIAYAVCTGNVPYKKLLMFHLPLASTRFMFIFIAKLQKKSVFISNLQFSLRVHPYHVTEIVLPKSLWPTYILPKLPWQRLPATLNTLVPFSCMYGFFILWYLHCSYGWSCDWIQANGMRCAHSQSPLIKISIQDLPCSFSLKLPIMEMTMVWLDTELGRTFIHLCP